jgi:hypothetical protein
MDSTIVVALIGPAGVIIMVTITAWVQLRKRTEEREIEEREEPQPDGKARIVGVWTSTNGSERDQIDIKTQNGRSVTGTRRYIDPWSHSARLFGDSVFRWSRSRAISTGMDATETRILSIVLKLTFRTLTARNRVV